MTVGIKHEYGNNLLYKKAVLCYTELIKRICVYLKENGMNGYWICADEIPQKAKLYCFEHSFIAKGNAKMTASICADSRYTLYVNGSFVCDGPCRGSQYVRYYEQPDLTSYIKEGENIIRIEVLYATENMLTTVMREYRPALWFNGILTDSEGQKPIYSDESWSCRRLDSKIFDSTGRMSSLPPAEMVLGKTEYTNIPVHSMYEPNIEGKCYFPWGIRELYPLSPRMIPLIKPRELKHFNIVRCEQGMIDIDAGAYTTSMVELRFCGREGSKLTVIYAECYTDDNYAKNMRDDITGMLSGHVDTIVLTGEPQTFSTFFYRAFRFIRLKFEDDGIEFDMESSGYREYFYPLDENGSFECNDERLNRIWDISKNTVRCCMHEMFVDCPYYEQQQYGMDSALQIMFALRMSSDTRLIKKTLIDFVHSQLPDGMLQANFPSTVVQVIPTFSLFWVLTVREYLRYVGDVKFVRGLTGTIDKIFEAFNAYIDDNGLVGPSHYWHFTDWVPTWNIGIPDGGTEEPLTVGCLIYATALQAASEICIATGRDELGAEYVRRQQAMIDSVNRHCFDAERGLYRDTPSKRNFSEHTALWAVLSGAVKGEKATELMEKVMNEDVSRCTFSMNYYLFRALEKADCYKYSDRIMEGWQKMLDMHCTTWCENPDSPRSECHGWSSAPIYEMSAVRLGVKPSSDGFKSVEIKPVTDGLEWARGTVPTPYGVISVEWKKTDGRLIFDAHIPENADMEISLCLENMPMLITHEHLIHAETELN